MQAPEQINRTYTRCPSIQEILRNSTERLVALKCHIFGGKITAQRAQFDEVRKIQSTKELSEPQRSTH